MKDGTFEHTLATVLEKVAAKVGQGAERSPLVHGFAGEDLSNSDSQLLALVRVGRAHLIRFSPFHLSVDELFQVVRDGFPVVWLDDSAGRRQWWVFHRSVGAGLEGLLIEGKDSESIRWKAGQLRAKLKGMGKSTLEWCLIGQPLLIGNLPQSNHLVGSAMHGDATKVEHSSIAPWQRLMKMMRPEAKDVGSLFLFALFTGVLGLATPLAVEWVVTTVGFGRYLQPLFVLSLILLTLLLFAGMMRVLQAYVVEVIQRRLFARIVGDLAYRIPNSRRSSLHGTNGTELVNRFLDVATIQKGVASLLLDGISIALTTVIGMVLLAFYHPFLLGFDLVLLLCMVLITFFLGRGGVRTAVDESIQKYRLTHWFQDVISNPTAFRMYGGDAFSIDRANRITIQYLDQRVGHFAVLLRQLIFAVTLQALASTALLGIGGWLVLNNQLTLGQLVASELVVTVIVGAFAKISKTLENFYDLMASVDKVGHLLDLRLEGRAVSIPTKDEPASIRWVELECEDELARAAYRFGSCEIAAGARVALTCPDSDRASILMSMLSGFREPSSGHADIDGMDTRDLSRNSFGQSMALASSIEVFHGTILENVGVHRQNVPMADIQWSLELVGLRDVVLRLPSGLETLLETGGYPLTREQSARLMLARAIAGRPRVLLIDHTLDWLPQSHGLSILHRLTAPDLPWTLIVASYNEAIVRKLEPITLEGQA